MFVMWRRCEHFRTPPAQRRGASGHSQICSFGDGPMPADRPTDAMDLHQNAHGEHGDRAHAGSSMDPNSRPKEESIMAVHQCPRCELRFISSAETEWHLLEEHADARLALRLSGTTASTTRSPPAADPS